MTRSVLRYLSVKWKGREMGREREREIGLKCFNSNTDHLSTRHWIIKLEISIHFHVQRLIFPALFLFCIPCPSWTELCPLQVHNVEVLSPWLDQDTWVQLLAGTNTSCKSLHSFQGPLLNQVEWSLRYPLALSFLSLSPLMNSWKKSEN